MLAKFAFLFLLFLESLLGFYARSVMCYTVQGVKVVLQVGNCVTAAVRSECLFGFADLALWPAEGQQPVSG